MWIRLILLPSTFLSAYAQHTVEANDAKLEYGWAERLRQLSDRRQLQVDNVYSCGERCTAYNNGLRLEVCVGSCDTSCDWFSTSCDQSCDSNCFSSYPPPSPPPPPPPPALPPPPPFMQTPIVRLDAAAPNGTSGRDPINLAPLIIIPPRWLPRVGARMSTELSSNPASYCMDGQSSTMCHSACPTATSCTTENPWLEIDLGAVHYVDKVQILNRIDCCTERLNYHEVWVGASWGTSTSTTSTAPPHTRCIAATASASAAIVEHVCELPRLGRYVTLTLPGWNRILHLREVSVFGYPPPPPPYWNLWAAHSTCSISTHAIASSVVST